MTGVALFGAKLGSGIDERLATRAATAAPRTSPIRTRMIAILRPSSVIEGRPRRRPAADRSAPVATVESAPWQTSASRLS
jgi:hypothetical protein